MTSLVKIVRLKFCYESKIYNYELRSYIAARKLF